MSDWYAVARAVWDHPFFRAEPYTEREAWMWLIGQAAWRPTRVRIKDSMITLQRGQCAFSIRFLAEKWGWSKGKVERFADALKNETMIGTQAGRNATVITICNYEKFQHPMDESGTQTETRTGTQTGTQTGTKKNNLTSKQKNPPPTREGGLFGPKVFSTEETELPDGPPAKPKGLHLCPPEWEPTPEHHALGDELGLTPREVHESASGMRDWSLGGGHKKLDWNATFRNWIRRDAKERRKSGSGPGGRKSYADIARGDF